MSELVRAREKTDGDRERCAFCHDVLHEDADAGTIRAECAKCGTPHHAGYFFENGGCAVMGCDGKQVRRTGDLEERLDLVALGRAVGAEIGTRASPEARAAVERRFTRTATFLGVYLTIVGLGMLAIYGSGRTLGTLGIYVSGKNMLAGPFVGGLVAVIFCLWVWRVLRARRQDRSTIEATEEPGPPCPRCGEPLVLAPSGSSRFCCACGVGESLAKPEPKTDHAKTDDPKSDHSNSDDSKKA